MLLSDLINIPANIKLYGIGDAGYSVVHYFEGDADGFARAKVVGSSGNLFKCVKQIEYLCINGQRIIRYSNLFNSLFVDYFRLNDDGKLEHAVVISGEYISNSNDKIKWNGLEDDNVSRMFEVVSRYISVTNVKNVGAVFEDAVLGCEYYNGPLRGQIVFSEYSPLKWDAIILEIQPCYAIGGLDSDVRRNLEFIPFKYVWFYENDELFIGRIFPNEPNHLKVYKITATSYYECDEFWMNNISKNNILNSTWRLVGELQFCSDDIVSYGWIICVIAELRRRGIKIPGEDKGKLRYLGKVPSI